eukprot:SAG11_NODE_185_length_13160_cov_9.118521_6_plen_215_part_00
MNDEGSGVLTPEMVLAAAEPPPEAPYARDARARDRKFDFMGLVGAGGAELALDGVMGTQGRLERTLGAKSVAPALGAPRKGQETVSGSSGLSLAGVLGGSNPRLMAQSPRCVSAFLAVPERGIGRLRALIGVSPTSKQHTRIASPSYGDGCESMIAKPFLSAAVAGTTVLTLSQVHLQPTSPPLPWCGWVGDEKTRATHFTCPLIRDLCLFGLA